VKREVLSRPRGSTACPHRHDRSRIPAGSSSSGAQPAAGVGAEAR
jgi:hypothetical protein